MEGGVTLKTSPRTCWIMMAEQVPLGCRLVVCFKKSRMCRQCAVGVSLSGVVLRVIVTVITNQDSTSSRCWKCSPRWLSAASPMAGHVRGMPCEVVEELWSGAWCRPVSRQVRMLRDLMGWQSSQSLCSSVVLALPAHALRKRTG
jgi:hypothetical protein